MASLFDRVKASGGWAGSTAGGRATIYGQNANGSSGRGGVGSTSTGSGGIGSTTATAAAAAAAAAATPAVSARPMAAPIAAAPIAPVVPIVDTRPDSREIFRSILNTYGFSTGAVDSLLTQTTAWTEQNFDVSTIASALLPTTAEYKQRFNGNETRVKAGFSALSPAEYLAQESSYRRVLATAGTPKSFYDSNDDFASWIANDVSPEEIQGRVTLASQLANNLDPAIIASAKNFGLNTSDLTAYFLDREKSVPLLQKKVDSIKLGSEFVRQGETISNDFASQLNDAGVTQSAARDAANAVVETSADYAKLAQVSGEAITNKELINSNLGLDAKATTKVKALASEERSRFTGGSAGNSSFGTNFSSNF